jgi:hypothetical protein
VFAYVYPTGCGKAVLGHLAILGALIALGACATPGIDTTPSDAGLPAIAVQAPVGLSRDHTTRLGNQLIQALLQRGVEVAPAPESPARFKLQGVCSASGGGQSTSVACVWDALTSAGTRAHRIVTEETVGGASPGDPWSVVGDDTISGIAVSVADKIAAWLPGASSGGSSLFALPSLPSLGSGPAATVALAGVSGAPGDGNEALARAMSTALRGQNIPVTGANPRAHRLAATVALADAGGGEQGITIEWTLTDPQGISLGTITQRNRVPAGSLNGPWGATAETSAAAAARGVIELLPPAS